MSKPTAEQVKAILEKHPDIGMQDAARMAKAINMHDELVAEIEEAIGWLDAALTEKTKTGELFEILVATHDALVKVKAKAEAE